MDYQTIMQQLEELGNAQTKKTYINHGAKEPLFGVTINKLNPIAKKIKTNHALAEELYASGNYDAMYLAAMIADPKTMTEADFDRWMSQAYFHMISDYTVAILLADSPMACAIADKWIASGDELKMSAGWCTYTWLLGIRKDDFFDIGRIKQLLKIAQKTIHQAPNRTRYAINSFVTAVGISYLPLHNEAVAAAEAIGKVEVYMGKTSCKVPLAAEYIAKADLQGRLGFKRKKLRC